MPGQTGVATHACLFMLAGNTIRWKQVVAYNFSVILQFVKVIFLQIMVNHSALLNGILSHSSNTVW